MGASRRAAPRTYAVECGPASCRNDSSWCCHFLLLSLVWSRASWTSCLLSPDSSSAAEPAAHPFPLLGAGALWKLLTTRQRVENECLLFLLMGERQRSSHKARFHPSWRLRGGLDAANSPLFAWKRLNSSCQAISAHVWHSPCKIKLLSYQRHKRCDIFHVSEAFSANDTVLRSTLYFLTMPTDFPNRQSELAG